MSGDSAQVDEVETSGDLISPAGVAEQEQWTRSNNIGGEEKEETVRPSKDQAKKRTEAEDDAKDLASSSGSEEVQEIALFSPGFSSAAAKAGWDAEALLMAALSRSPMDSGNMPEILHSHVIHADVRKRDKCTPLSSARRNRRVRLENNNGSPLGRLPMKPLTLLSDNELENIGPANENCPFSVAEGKENCSHSSLYRQADPILKGKEKERTPTKPVCMEQLREELSCAVCLDICFEPSTISCGHSFCGTCLQSVLQKCGPRCPKCRQPLRSEAVRGCRTNTVLWNTIQILFPKESAARMQDTNEALAKKEAAANRPLTEGENAPVRYLGARPFRTQPWRSPAYGNVNRTSVMGNLRTSFQAASELMMHNSTESDDNGRSEQYDRGPWDNREETERLSRVHSRRRQSQAQATEQVDAAPAARLQQFQAASELMHNSTHDNGRSEQHDRGPREDRARLNRAHSRRQSQATQEQVDAALAARLQQAELNAVPSGAEDLLIIEESRQVSRNLHNPSVLSRTATMNLRTATVNLRTVAQRVNRSRRVRTRS